jgi:8-oxo-dGTP pyrophosphatase MutT (NUDIX family)
VDEPSGPVARECVEGYLLSRAPLELLLFRRTPARGEIWVPISGKVEPTDADFEAALRRELVEETGLVNPREIFPLDWHVRFRADNGETWRLHAFGVAVDRSFSPTLSEEHEEWKWVPVAEAEGFLHYEDNRAAVRRLVESLSQTPSPKA